MQKFSWTSTESYHFTGNREYVTFLLGIKRKREQNEEKKPLDFKIAKMKVASSKELTSYE
jgi:hypothetical protein